MFKPLILIVDDEKEFADGLVKLVKSSGKYDAKAVYSAKDAFLEIEKNRWFLDIPKNRIACILLDIKMPEMNGMEFMKKLWETRKDEFDIKNSEIDRMREYIPVVILSAWEDEEKWKNTPRKAGYLKKPVDGKELFAVLDRIVKGGEPEIEKMKVETTDKGIEKGYIK